MSLKLVKYIDTKTYLFLGEEKQLKIIEGKSHSVNLTQKEIIISGESLSDDEIKLILSEWYKKEARKILMERTKYFSKLTWPIFQIQNKSNFTTSTWTVL